MSGKGLFIKDKKQIKYISGPVSMYYLKPTKKTYKKFKELYGINLPIVLSFGDLHRYYTDQCYPCDEHNKCYSIYDKNFLKLIDSLGEKYKIDFYTESSDLHLKSDLEYEKIDMLSGQGILFEDFIKNTVYPCHNTELRKRDIEEYYKECPTRNIRWHYSDTRNMYNKFESVMFEYLDNIAFHPNMINLQYIDPTKDYIFSESRQFSKDFLETMLKILECNKNEKEMISTFSREITELIFYYINKVKRYSLLYKQIISNVSIIPLFKEILYDRIKNPEDVKNAFPIIFDEKNRSEFKKIIQALLNRMNGGFINSISNVFSGSNSLLKEENELLSAFINGLIFWLKAILLDIYYLFRMLKNPVGDINSYLSLCYFGDAHTVNTVKILQKFFDYKKVLSIDYDENEKIDRRCIKINKKINLQEDLKVYSKIREKYN